MMRRHLLASILIILAISFCSGQQNEDLLCPDPATIVPCICDRPNPNWAADVRCRGPTIDQSALERVLLSLRQANNVGPLDLLYIPYFSIEDTNLTQIDMTPFLHSNITFLKMEFNSQLTSLSVSTENDTQIYASTLTLLGNKFDDQSVEEMLPLFVSEVIEYLDLSQNFIQGSRVAIEDGSGDIEIFRGLSTLKNLKDLRLGMNPLEELSGGQFKRNSQLEFISVQTQYLLTMGADAFLVNEPEIESMGLTISMQLGGLSEDNFNYSLSSLVGGPSLRAIGWNLDLNDFTTYPEAVFKQFLDDNQGNWFSSSALNPSLICDDRMKWIKDGQSAYEGQVVEVRCLNDPGQTIFTTSLIS